MEADFSGYVTKAGLKCADGRTITPKAFEHMDGKKVPLLWQHGHDNPENVLGHVLLESRDDGVYGHAYLNETPQGDNARKLVEHGDITMFSIFANQLVEKSKSVLHGFIREVSLVLSGANPGARIENVAVRHSDGDIETLDEEAVIYSGQTLEHADSKSSGKTVKDVYQTFSDEQKEVVHFMIGAALEAADSDDDSASHSDLEEDEYDDDDEDSLNHKEGSDMTRNVFEGNDTKTDDVAKHTLSHSDVKAIVADAQNRGSLKAAVESYALQHGIEDIDMLFPEAKNLTDRPEWIKRRTEWVAGVLNGTRKSPFSRIKTMTADITHEEARALGYIKGNMKKEEFFGLAKRTTGPTTVYKKQKLDRDDIIDITDFDVVSWLKAEMRVMLEEELARAILVGDGRPVEDPANPGEPNPDKIKDPAGQQDGLGVRSIANEDDLYATKVTMDFPSPDDSEGWELIVDEIQLAMDDYKGSGTPTLFTTRRTQTRLLQVRDRMGRRLWRNAGELAAELGVDRIVPVEVLEQHEDLVGIIVNLSDYVVGTDRGGEINFFDDFDIDYNQYKYLYETRLSGALVKMKSAIVLLRGDDAETGDEGDEGDEGTG